MDINQEIQALWNAVESAQKLIVTLSRIVICHEDKIELGGEIKKRLDEHRKQWNVDVAALPEKSVTPTTDT